MQTFRKFLIGLIVALAVIVPLTIAASATNPTAATTQQPILRIAGEPTPTPTPANGQCHGVGC